MRQRVVNLSIEDLDKIKKKKLIALGLASQLKKFRMNKE